MSQLRTETDWDQEQSAMATRLRFEAMNAPTRGQAETQNPTTQALAEVKKKAREASQTPLLLTGDVARLSTDRIVQQIHEPCRAAGLQIRAEWLNTALEERVIKVFDVGARGVGRIDICSIYPAGVNGAQSPLLVVPEGAPPLPEILKPLAKQLNGEPTTEQPSGKPVNEQPSEEEPS